MHTIDLLDEATQLARSSGIEIREENLEGQAGICELRGRVLVFLDPSASAAERLMHVLEALRLCRTASASNASPMLTRLLDLRKSA